MPVLPLQYSASSNRRPSQPDNLAASFVDDTSSRIRLRNKEDLALDRGPESRSTWILIPSSDDDNDFSTSIYNSIDDSSSTPSKHDTSQHQSLRRRAQNPSDSFHHELLPAHLAKPSGMTSRQTQYFFAIPLSYAGLNSGPSPGTVVGITLGSVLGFLILVWLINSVINSPPGQTRYIEGDASEIVVTRRSDRGGKRQRSSRKTARSRRTTQRSETASGQSASVSGASAAPPPPRQPSPRRERTERIIQETVRVRQESRPPPVAMPMPPGGMPEMRETINISVVDERRPGRVDGDDFIEVMEEHNSDVSGAPPPGARRSSRREPSRGAYRTVDPAAYGGGNFPSRPVRR